MNLKQLTVTVMTVDREPCYVHETLASMFMAEPLLHEVPVVHLVAGTNRLHYLENYRHHDRVQVHGLTDFEQQLISTWSLKRRFCHNYCRCLSLPIAERGGLLVCEDDVIFRDDFLSHLAATIDEIEALGSRDYCLALTSCHDFEAGVQLAGGAAFCRYVHPFYGTQAMYYPAPVAPAVCRYVYQHGVEQFRTPGDLLIGELYGDRMYVCVPSLANHIGLVSTGIGLGGRCQSPSFDRPHPRDRGHKRRLLAEA